MASPDLDPVAARVVDLQSALQQLQDVTAPTAGPRPSSAVEDTLEELSQLAHSVTGRLDRLAQRWDDVRPTAVLRVAVADSPAEVTE